MTPEGKVVKDIKLAMKELGCAVRKCVWVGHSGAPDLFIMSAPLAAGAAGRHLWVEVKAPGKKPTAHQLREHEIMRKAGCQVIVADNVIDVIRAVISDPPRTREWAVLAHWAAMLDKRRKHER